MPELQSTLAFSVIVLFIVCSPGPNLFLLLRNTPSGGREVGWMNTAGFCAAILSHAFLSLIGVGAVIAASATLFSAMKFCGAAYLIWLGIKSLKSAFQRQNITVPGQSLPQKNLSAVSAFSQGYLTNILNPKPALFYLAAFPQFISVDVGEVLMQGMVLGGIHAAIAAIWYGSIVAAIDTVSQWLRRPAPWRWVQGISGIALILLGARLMFSRGLQASP